jgi:hypothetical protein
MSDKIQEIKNQLERLKQGSCWGFEIEDMREVFPFDDSVDRNLNDAIYRGLEGEGNECYGAWYVDLNSDRPHVWIYRLRPLIRPMWVSEEREHLFHRMSDGSYISRLSTIQIKGTDSFLHGRLEPLCSQCKEKGVHEVEVLKLAEKICDPVSDRFPLPDIETGAELTKTLVYCDCIFGALAMSESPDRTELNLTSFDFTGDR